MSIGLSLQTIVYFGSREISVFSLTKKVWKEVSRFELNQAVPTSAKKYLQGDVLVLNSDSYSGHLQIMLPNKKSELTDEKIATVLQEDYDIDTDSYEFASQKFTLSREFVQLSISGVERESYTTIVEWLSKLDVQKAWIMPFGWFLSALKSVEPVLLAVARDTNEILISHHYLGVDDAREIAESDLLAYVQSRKAERKETHLLYVQSSPDVMDSFAKVLGDTVALHPLIEEESTSESVFADVINAVWSKGEEAIAELLHFEATLEETNTEVSEDSEDSIIVDSKQSTNDGTETELEESSLIESSEALDLPKPMLPTPLPPVSVVEPVLEAPSAGEYQENPIKTEVVSDQSDDFDQDDEVEKTVKTLEKSEDLDASDDKTDLGSEIDSEPPTDHEEKPELQIETQESEPELESDSIVEVEAPKRVWNELAHAGKGVARSNENRYVEMPKKTSWTAALLVFLFVVVLTSVVGGAVFWSQQSYEVQNPLLPSTTPTPTPVLAAEEPVEVPEEIVETLSDEQKNELSILVLNATGTPGLAGKTQDKLEAAGWGDISVGNATGSYDDALFVYTETDGVILTLEDDLDITITEATKVSESKADQYDIVFIIADDVSWQ